MLKVFFTAATSYDGILRKQYKDLVSLLKKTGVELLSGEQVVDDKLLSLDSNLTKKEIFERERKLIEKADCVIAEVSRPSLGVGGEIVYALIKEKPVLALVLTDYEDKISPMLAGNPSDNLFLERYSLDKLSYVINDFLNHVKKSKKRKGKLIVIDGGDGSGKTTQTQLMLKYLEKNKISCRSVDFPQYYNSFHGKIVARFLRGEFGNIDEVSPYLASLAYALDRASVKREMEDFLEKGGFIVANRYATSSLAHQSAKFTNKTEREEFLKWLYELEYKVHKMPKENLVIYLYVPWKIGLELTKTKGDRAYLKGKEDIAEKDLNHRIQSEKMYLELTKRYKHWVKIDCIKNGKLLPPKMIHELIISTLHKKNIL